MSVQQIVIGASCVLGILNLNLTLALWYRQEKNFGVSVNESGERADAPQSFVLFELDGCVNWRVIQSCLVGY